MKKLSIILLLVLIAINLPQSAYADSFSVGVYPPLVHIQMPPNSHIQRGLVVKNYADTPLVLHVQIRSFKGSDKKNGEISLLTADPNAAFLQEQVHVFEQNRSVNELLLSPKEVKNLLLDVSTPSNAADKDYYFSILFISDVSENPKQTGPSIQGAIASNVLLSILPQSEKAEGYIKSVHYPIFPKQGPVEFSIEIVNQGKHVFRGYGNIDIKNILTGSITHIPLLAVDVLSQESRYIPDAHSGSLEHAVWNSGVLFGIYQATLDVRLNNDQYFHRSYLLYSFPLTIITGGLIFAIISIVIFIRIQRELE